MCKFVLRGAINKNQSLQELFRQAPFRLYYRQLCWNASPTTGQQLPAVLTLHTELLLCLAAPSHSSISQASALSLLGCFSIEVQFCAILSPSGGATAHPGVTAQPEPCKGQNPIHCQDSPTSQICTAIKKPFTAQNICSLGFNMFWVWSFFGFFSPSVLFSNFVLISFHCLKWQDLYASLGIMIYCALQLSFWWEIDWVEQTGQS